MPIVCIGPLQTLFTLINTGIANKMSNSTWLCMHIDICMHKLRAKHINSSGSWILKNYGF